MTDTYDLTDRYRADDGTVLLTGIQALARLPLEQLRVDRRRGLNTAAFISGYQGSPLGGYGEAARSAAATAPDLPIEVQPGVNEELAASAVMGSQLVASRGDARFDGVVGLWYGKGPGLDRATDALRHAVFAGTAMHGGAIALVGDDPQAKSSTLPSSSAGICDDLHMPVLYPGDPAEALSLGRHAIYLSRATGLWAALKIVADVADGSASVRLNADHIDPVMPLLDGAPYHRVPDGRIITPASVETERELIEVRYQLAKAYAAANHLNTVTVAGESPWLGIVSSGITYREVREALSRLGLSTDSDVAGAGIRLLKLGMPLPFNAATIVDFAQGLDEVLVVEEKRPLIESLLKDALYDSSLRPAVVGKVDEQGEILVKAWGVLDADYLVDVMRRRLEPRLGDRLIAARPARTKIRLPLAVERAPYFCSGCPHNRSTEVPPGSVVGAGIGCHTMMLYMDPERVGDAVGLTCMGNEGAQWIGMSGFVDTGHLIQNLGDGTFFHSGQLAIQAAVAARVNITYKLLYNGTVAMTGGQDAEGGVSVPRIAEILLAHGVSQVLVTSDDPDRHRGELPAGVEAWHRDRLLEAQERLAKVGGVTVLIHDQACAAEARRDRKRGIVETPRQRVVINHRICEGCGDCGQVSNCLSVQPIDTPFGRKTEIDQTTCNLDYSCLDGDCPSFMTVTSDEPRRLGQWLRRARSVSSSAGSTLGRNGRSARIDVMDPPTMDNPDAREADSFAMRICGIGGTGVVTVSQVLGTAAMLDGYDVAGLDQIGLSQKAGPVVSDLRLSRGQPLFTNRIGDAQADLLLVFDQLVAGSDKGLSTSDPDRTQVVGSNSAVPTGSMITDPSLVMPTPDELATRIADATAGQAHWADAQAVTTDLFGQATTANVFVVGMAVQSGALPIEAARVEEAIELNGVSVATNLAAFRWGRVQVADPDLLVAARASAHPVEPEVVPERFGPRLDALGLSSADRLAVSRWANEVAAWGDDGDAAAYFDELDKVAAAEAAAAPGRSELVMAAAFGLYKLTAYKDEYEVARLMTDDDGIAAANELAAAGATVAWKLHPPMLRALGMESKVTIGTWATPGIRALARAKSLRGKPWDPFGRAEVRRVERGLRDEYLGYLHRALAVVGHENYDAVVALAGFADEVRGYEDIKLANVARWRERCATALALLER